MNFSGLVVDILAIGISLYALYTSNKNNNEISKHNDEILELAKEQHDLDIKLKNFQIDKNTSCHVCCALGSGNKGTHIFSITFYDYNRHGVPALRDQAMTDRFSMLYVYVDNFAHQY